ncbi:quinoprotein glucose dehydrogenase [Lentibacillus salicampi]|uniref:Quinoprotein glucose dehydrogenase n=2 Tax=Lentibacillus salicampi TaxID=175306 RepID=A0A4Y9AH88_9BACI|nr:quinoprotein glucose dehydrogenase [Lentibacillus salicampi]
MYISLFGTIFAAGIIIGLVLFINTDDNKKAEENHAAQNQELYQKESVQVLEDTVKVVSTDDGEINANNLRIPWTVNKSENTFFLSQRDGNIVEIDGDFGLVEVQTVDVSETIYHEGQAGFLGFELAPDFEDSNQAFAYHTYEKDGEILNRIVSLTLEDNTWKEENVLLDGIPGGDMNTGGRIAIGPDNMLYATTGDTGQPDTAQDLDNLAGKILRMELDGAIPEDNPFESSYVYTYGHRNSQGLAWDEQGKMYSSEHGEDGHDEINLIEAGNNYGWPVIQGDEEAEDMVAPIHHSGEETWAPSGMAYNDGELFVASLAGSQIFTYNIADQEVNEFFDDAGRLRDVMIDENALFTITNNHDDRGNPSQEDDRLIHISLTGEVSGD